jgi:hypothetical protein
VVNPTTIWLRPQQPLGNLWIMANTPGQMKSKLKSNLNNVYLFTMISDWCTNDISHDLCYYKYNTNEMTVISNLLIKSKISEILAARLDES